MNVERFAELAAGVGRAMPAIDVDLVAELVVDARACPRCGERSNCPHDDDCPQLGADLGERGCNHCGHSSNCTYDDCCGRWHTEADRRAELRAELDLDDELEAA